jgi:hypothetical protein
MRRVPQWNAPHCSCIVPGIHTSRTITIPEFSGIASRFFIPFGLGVAALFQEFGLIAFSKLLNVLQFLASSQLMGSASGATPRCRARLV